MREKDKQIRAEVKQLLEQAEAADAEEDKLHGKDQRGDELPEELQRRESRLKKIREAKRAVEARAREKAVAEGGDPKEAKPEEKDQYNFTDPESRIMKGTDGFVQGYNAQAIRIEEDLVDQLFNSSEKRLARVLLLLATAARRPSSTPHSSRMARTRRSISVLSAKTYTSGKFSSFIIHLSKQDRQSRTGCTSQSLGAWSGPVGLCRQPANPCDDDGWSTNR